MRIPERLVSLANEGIIEEVVRPLMSGKEAEVFLVVSGGELRVAKVYKDAQNRTFKNRAEYTEGRSVRNSRDQRAMDKRSKHGRAQDESAWRSTEVDMIYRLRSAGVRVPVPYHFIDGVLIMELVTGPEGEPAPRLGEMRLEAEEARAIFDRLLAEVVRMLCAGVVHGDLSDFNVLMGADGPVVIDFPQSVDAARNQNARKLLLRDVANLHRFLAKFLPNLSRRHHAEEMWDLYSQSLLTPETRLRGIYRPAERMADTAAVLELIGDATYDERKRREATGQSMRGMGAAPPEQPRQGDGGGPRGRGGPPPQRQGEPPVYQGRGGAQPLPSRNAPQPVYQGRGGAQPLPSRNAPQPVYQGRGGPQPLPSRNAPQPVYQGRGGSQPLHPRSPEPQVYQGRGGAQPLHPRQGEPGGQRDRGGPPQPRHDAPQGNRGHGDAPQPPRRHDEPQGNRGRGESPPPQPRHDAPQGNRGRGESPQNQQRHDEPQGNRGRGGPPPQRAASAPATREVEVLVAPGAERGATPPPRRVEVVVAPSAPRGRQRNRPVRA